MGIRSLKGGLAALLLAGSMSCVDDTDLYRTQYCQNLEIDEANGIPRPDDICNGFDDDCDAELPNGEINADLIDEDCDRDRDGFCDSTAVYQECDEPDPINGCTGEEILIGSTSWRLFDAYCTNSTPDCTAEYCTPTYDCDDTNPNVHPNAQEICDALDNNCDGEYNETFPGMGEPCVGLVGGGYEWDESMENTDSCHKGQTICEIITDLDGVEHGVLGCEDFQGPATETCDGYDNDCDGFVDNNDALGETTQCYFQIKEDENGNEYVDIGTEEDRVKMDNAVSDCRPGFQICEEGGLSDECYGAVVPEDYDECNGEDDDCDGVIDQHHNNDGDPFSQCQDDCNDFDNTIYPGAPEICNDGIDQDCDGSDLVGVDLDGDGFYGSDGCIQQDCVDDPSDPLAAEIFPGQEEYCNCRDDNCDGIVDNDIFGIRQDHLYIPDCSESNWNLINLMAEGLENAQTGVCYAEGDNARFSLGYIGGRMIANVEDSYEPEMVAGQVSAQQFQNAFDDIPLGFCHGYEPSIDVVIYAACLKMDNAHPFCYNLEEQIEDFRTTQNGEILTLWRDDAQAHIYLFFDEVGQSYHGFSQHDARDMLNLAGIIPHLYTVPEHMATENAFVEVYDSYYDRYNWEDDYGQLVRNEDGDCTGYVYNLVNEVVSGNVVSTYEDSIVRAYCGTDAPFSCDMPDTVLEE